MTSPTHAVTEGRGRGYQHPAGWYGRVAGANGEAVPSVTTILGGIGSAEGLIGWSATAAATAAATEHAWRELATDEAIAYLASRHKAVRGEAATRGDIVHQVAERMLNGGEATDIERAMYPGYVAALEMFFTDYQPRPEAVEATCWNLPRYAGTADAIAKLKGVRGLTIIDWKTSSRIEAKTAAQLAAYAECPIYTAPGSDDAVAMPHISRGAVVRLDYAQYELRFADLKTGSKLFNAALTVHGLHRISAVYPEKSTKSATPEHLIESHAATLRDRIVILQQHAPDAYEALAARWPTDVPTFKAGGPQSIAHVRTLAQIVAKVELDYATPF